MRNGKILITGGSGFIGAAAVTHAIKDWRQVTVVDNNSRGNMRRLRAVIDDIEFIEGDVRDAETIVRAAKGADTILHLAAVNGTENFYSHPDLVLDVGVRGMLSVLDAVCINEVRTLVTASSSEVYQTPATVPTPENVQLVCPDPLNPRYSYGGSKIISELLAIHNAPTCLERSVIFRPHNVYGADMGFEHVIPQFIMRAQRCANAANDNKINFAIQGNGLQTRSFVYIDDFIRGLSAVMQKGDHKGIYHIGTHDEIRIKDLAHLIGKSMRLDMTLDTMPEPPGATVRRCPDTAKLESLGYQPTVSLETGIDACVKWYLENQALWPNKD